MSERERGIQRRILAPTRALLVLWTAWLGGACASNPFSSAPSQPASGDLKLLFIGSSYFEVNDMPGVFAAISQSAGKKVFVRYDVASGYYLDHFAHSDRTAGIIKEQDWDYVVVQGIGVTAAYPDTHHTLGSNRGYHPEAPSLAELKRKVSANHPETALLYMMPWAFEDGLLWIAGQEDDFFDMQERIRANSLHWADSLDLVLAPVGEAWREVLLDNPGEHYLHMSDFNHPSYQGTFLSAAVIFSAVFKENSSELGYRGFLPAGEAEVLRGVASWVVLDSLSLWRIR